GLTGGPGSDTMSGGIGDDAYFFAAAAAVETDTVSEGANEGRDRLDFGALAANDPVAVDLGGVATLATHARRTVVAGGAAQAIEDATGGASDDRLTRNNADNAPVGGGRHRTPPARGGGGRPLRA